ncbi:hypothetical protein HZZ00_37985 (plasmid) [Streptomyces sp. NEAU-sy36]|uniref:hypothetical protein n=1 Tax=unclassified Streptomyces TaxID=2593676 RepID=UPI0015D628D9|nr:MULTISPECIES: hypothetical protein [unclassified Streptomyces]QLJ06822.1 hypothetical protein HZZ00_37985 [Streptomyces sp. NEAU-sy36]
MDVPDLSAIDDDQFEDIAISQAHPRSRDPELWALLASPEHIDRTRTILTNVHARTAAALRRRKAEREQFHLDCHARGAQGKKEWFESRPEYEKWRRGAAGFHQTVQTAISELSKIQRSQNRAVTNQGGHAARDALRKLAVAVHRHQARHAKSGEVAAQEDYELWQMLDHLTVPCGPQQEPTTLRTMLDFYWTDVDMVSDSEEKQTAAERTMRQAPAGRSARFTGTPRARHIGNDKGLAS